MKKYLNFIIAAFAVIICSFLSFSNLDKKAADLFQRPLKSTVESPNVMMINVDDFAVDNIGVWPFSREVYARMVTVLKDLGAESVVFDLSFLDKTLPKTDEDYVKNKLPAYVSDSMNNLDVEINNILVQLEEGFLTVDDLEDIRDYLLYTTSDTKNTIDLAFYQLIKDQDGIFADSIEFSNNTYLTLTFEENDTESPADDEFVENYIALNNLKVLEDDKIREYQGVQPAIFDFASRARSAGFVNARPDADGYMRRVDLIVKYKGNYYGQLVFVPLLEHYGYPEIEVTNKYITLKNAKIDENTVRDIKIPRDEKGSVILKYPKKIYDKYNCASLYDIYRIYLLEKDFFEAIETIDGYGYFDYWDGENLKDIAQSITYLRDALSAGEDEDLGITYDLYSEYVNEFYSSTKDFLTGSAFTDLLEVADGDEEMEIAIMETFADIRERFNTLSDVRKRYKEKVQNTMCIIGTSATSTTDYGLIQYQEHYPNPGVHYAMANQILAQDFVDDSPVYVPIIIAVLICFIYAFLTKWLKSTGKQIVIGIAMLAATVLLIYLYFFITRQYVGVVIPLFSLGVTFVACTVTGFLTSSHEKRFIQNAFSQCLSPDVVKDLVEHPENFKLGGETYDMSAIFTDIQKFSGFSELLTAAQLVALLNYYLTKMSDTLMEMGATVDKYEGDAIVAFVGAPLNFEDHAKRSCRAAIKMKKLEIEMNKEIREIAAMETAPAGINEDLFEAFKIMVDNKREIFTRIGINSGDMVAGYMGSDGKKNYTMMGNNVNLASRLEGVNKQYSTGGILISEATRNKLDDDFIVRSLDRVRVVNVNTPIRLYEVIEETAEASDFLKKYISAWEIAMKNFEEKNYEKALEEFKMLSSKKDDDKVARYYINLIETYFIKGKYPTELDDAGVAYNPEDNVFKLMQK